MKRRTRNDKVLRAITIGLATMIAATSAPITVLADENENNDPGETLNNTQATPSETEQAAETASTVETTVESAASSVEAAVSTVVNGDTNQNIAPVSSIEAGNESQDEVTAFVNATGTNTNAPAVIPVFDENGQVQVDAQGNPVTQTITAEQVQQLFVEAEQALAPASTATPAPAPQKLEDCKNVADDLKFAAAEEEKADVSAKAVVDDAAAAQDIADLAKQSVDSANKKANGYINTINDETKSDEEVQQAFNDLDKLTNATQSDLEAKQKSFNDIKTKFNQAKEDLKKAEKNYSDAIEHAGSGVSTALTDLREAQAYVDQLSDAYDAAEAALKDEQGDAADIKEKIATNSNNKNADWGLQRAVLKSVVLGYIIPQLKDGGAEIISEDLLDFNKGFDTQDSNHATVVYKGSDGNTHTLYFSYDRENRKFSDDDQWYSVGNSKGIIIYEKTEEEVKASDYQKEYNKLRDDQNISTLEKGKTAEGKEKYKVAINDLDSKYQVYNYTDNKGEKHFITRDEINKAIANGSGKVEEENFAFFVVDEYGRYPATLFRQNTSKNAQFTLNINDADLQKFIDNATANYEKIQKYDAQIDAAKDAVDKAVTQTNELKDAIGKLENNHVAKNVLFAEMSDELAKYMTEEELARFENVETEEDAIAIIDKILERAEKELNDAKLELDELISKRDEIKEKLDQVPEEITTPAETDVIEDAAADDDADDAGEVTYATASDAVRESVDAALEALGLPAMTTTTAAIPAPAMPAGLGTGAGTGAGVAAPAAADQGVLGVREEDPTTKTESAEKKQDGVQQLKKLADEVLPLSDTPFDLSDPTDPSKIPWWWLVVIAVLGAAGIKAYNDYKKKQEAKQNNK